MVESNRAADKVDSSVLFRNLSGSFEDEDDDEHEDEPLIAASPRCVSVVKFMNQAGNTNSVAFT